jgi:putative transposase
MPRKPRFYLPGIPVHVVQRGNDRQAVFFSEEDYPAYLECFFEGAERYCCRIHAYVLMTNHVHFLMTPDTKESISRVFQHVGRKYVTYVNHQYKRTGTLWEGRHKGSLIDSGNYALACYRYIEMNPVKAAMVENPDEYHWSSYRFNAFGEGIYPVEPLSEYLSLGRSASERQLQYRNLFHASESVSNIKLCLETGTPLGDDRFKLQIESILERSVGYTRRGRPQKGL